MFFLFTSSPIVMSDKRDGCPIEEYYIIATTDQAKQKKPSIYNEQNQTQHNVEMVRNALDTSEKASFLLGENIALKTQLFTTVF